MRLQEGLGRRLRESRYNIWDSVGGEEYVYNGVSGGLLRLDPEQRREMERLLDGEDSRIEPALLLKLIQGRMLVEPDTDEIQLLRQRYEVTKRARDAMGLTIVTSLGCNFACPYCFEDKPSSRLTPGTAAAVVALVENQAARQELKSLRVTWFGGEPLVGRRELYSLGEQFLDVAHRYDIDYSADIITNGYLLDDEACQILAAQNVVSAQIGLDGPREIHDCYRPLLNGSGTFDRVLENIRRAAQYFDVSVRVNVDKQNVGAAQQVLAVLAGQGLADKVTVYLGHLVALTTNPAAPSAHFGADRCLSIADYSAAAGDFTGLATHLGLGSPSMPQPCGAPCTAVRENEWVVGPQGQLWKCWDNVGDEAHTVGTIFELNEGMQQPSAYDAYDPFRDAECMACIALPVCMGGCAHHAFEEGQRDNRCGTFRFEYRQQMRAFIEHRRRNGRRRIPVVSAYDG